MDAHTGSETNMRLARYWLEDCLLTHEHCALAHDPTWPPVLPSRVVDVSDLLKPRLLATHGIQDKYLTLSYCWGQGKRLLTTSMSYDRFQQELPLDDRLPSTFRDAFKVTKALGYNYIWIDALCILQDDPGDVRREMSRMGDIYRRSAITIFGSNGDSTDSGLFTSRDRVTHPSVQSLWRIFCAND
ncbi:heterokaryon incompatibility protein-domain-containing protein [Phaeosphaeria sp. MPI-PUGE-AT-0046c]|nr:heterokaryon incompatibility protein-domain-containing protein [Phaeosphaeria sp. MPI-PUGE-AT-0046c]